MNLLPIAAAALATGVVVREPLAALPLFLLTLAVRRLRPLRVHALAFAAGALLLTTRSPTPLLAVFPERSGLVRLSGNVVRGPDLPAVYSPTLLLDVCEVGGVPLRGRVLVFLPEGCPLPLPGARIEVTGRLSRPRRAANPGESDPREALEARGVTHVVTLRAPPSLVIVRPAPALSPRALVHRARLALDRAFTALPDPQTGAFLSCLLLGRRDRLPADLKEAFRRTGTSHFLAISGLHVGILAGILWLLIRALPIPRAPAAVAVAALILLYAALTGLRPPVLRASILVLLAAGSVVFRRKARPLHLLGLAAIFILFADPRAIGRAGFQLSFSAVLAILLLAKPIENGLFERAKLLDRFSVPRSQRVRRILRRYAMRSVPVSLAAWLGTAPLVLTWFGTLSLLVVPANLLVFPFIALLIPLGLLAAATGFALPATLLIDGLSALVNTLADVPGCCLTLPAPPPAAVAVYYTGLLLLTRRPRVGPGGIGLALLGLAGLAATGPLMRRPPVEPRLTVLSVGHGLAVALETPEGDVLLYDVGSTRPRITERVVLPWLRYRRISSIDALVLSHEDADHVSGAPLLGRTLPVGRIHPPGTLAAGDLVPVAGAVVEVLWPPSRGPPGGNDGSVVLRVRAGTMTVLLAGDLEEAGIRGLLATGADLKADVLVLPHHGRPTPMAVDLIKAVGASVLVASEGHQDPVEPAYPGVMKTSERGAITVTPGPRVATFR